MGGEEGRGGDKEERKGKKIMKERKRERESVWKREKESD